MARWAGPPRGTVRGAGPRRGRAQSPGPRLRSSRGFLRALGAPRVPGALGPAVEGPWGSRPAVVLSGSDVPRLLSFSRLKDAPLHPSDPRELLRGSDPGGMSLDRRDPPLRGPRPAKWGNDPRSQRGGRGAPGGTLAPTRTPVYTACPAAFAPGAGSVQATPVQASCPAGASPAARDGFMLD